MNLRQITSSLTAHGITWTIQDGMIFAVDVFWDGVNARREWINLSGVNIYRWLGH